MKTVKFVLPAFALLFAIAAAIASGNNEAALDTDYIINPSCTSITLQCDNVEEAPVCKYRISTSYFDVYDTKPQTTCLTVMRHSQNDGVLNP